MTAIPLPHPSTLPPLATVEEQETPPAVTVQLIEVREYTVRDPAAVVRHGRRARTDAPQIAALLRHEPGARGVHTAAALLAACHDADDLDGLGLELIGHASWIAAGVDAAAPALLEIRQDTR
ncbi:hypothetical protein TPA0906_00240 [Streptomyces olivaceus]|uniref:hypothetical protein n=1 Tax=Streptomyces olivaceus TaxID=47716 RepID=UPI0022ED9048|nr:hypothetical protein [Streptomyces olivaceus]GHI98158.1 hypothetical protein TPA0906_00240 [Streptomyces olivaceus]